MGHKIFYISLRGLVLRLFLVSRKLRNSNSRQYSNDGNYHHQLNQSKPGKLTAFSYLEI